MDAHGDYKLEKLDRHDEDDEAVFRNRIPMRKSFYNAETGEILSRTPYKWMKLILFYLAFYCALALLIYISFTVFYTTLSKSVPRVLLPQPGMSFAPCTGIENPTNHITYNKNNFSEVDYLVDMITDFLDKYGKRRDYGECMDQKQYGYIEGSPCVFLKINRIVGFKTRTYEKREDLPLKMPIGLKTFILGLSEEERKNRVWFSCVSLSNNISISYYPPHRSVHTKYVDYENSGRKDDGGFYTDDDYNRIIAVKFSNVPLGERVKVRCYIWAQNIKIGRRRDQGFALVRFEFKINDIKMPF